MNSRTTPEFWECFGALPQAVQRQAYRAYLIWQEDSRHPSLHFKCVDRAEQIYSVRVGLHWRAMALRADDSYTWFWIGSHADYDKLL